jgi:hypothetical protein
MPLTAEQLETLLRKSVADYPPKMRWCICVDPENCDQRLSGVRECRASKLGLPPRLSREGDSLK